MCFASRTTAQRHLPFYKDMNTKTKIVITKILKKEAYKSE